jgi:putative nucleotidyltransferase with HDIG domain
MDLETVFPLLNSIGSERLRTQVKQCYDIAMERGGWQSLDDFPFTLLVPNVYSYVQHVNNVTSMAYAIGQLRDDIDMDVLIAGGLLHDIGKLLEYEKKGDTIGKSHMGTYLRHPVSGAAIGLEVGVDMKIVNIIAGHSKEGELVRRCNETIIIHHCDFIDFEIAKGTK